MFSLSLFLFLSMLFVVLKYKFGLTCSRATHAACSLLHTLLRSICLKTWGDEGDVLNSSPPILPGDAADQGPPFLTFG
uniref:Putative secreted peptide n=1 Tax=Anopheles braziliensis TaxID=58242 RepID=A0A2M3ZPH8_9DIPT